jgi:hypothetical protein
MFGDYPTTFLLQHYELAQIFRPTPAALHQHPPYHDD